MFVVGSRVGGFGALLAEDAELFCREGELEGGVLASPISFPGEERWGFMCEVEGEGKKYLYLTPPATHPHSSASDNSSYLSSHLGLFQINFQTILNLA